ncbi:putative lipoprotein YmbA [Methylohalomonas lacus]|uniref:Lipoprotein YmbA n=1 Tax=Methylohalomonas lacus TaxID=398773 RepID=A0AAE3HKN7_9GAMM|nr:ABC-type transport auxiliary lipoprotein family protein [Methylohalomonas lacus]MCS3904110.1 putative lipoprotein YmbA [Methylohalomonas lacus]
MYPQRKDVRAISWPAGFVVALLALLLAGCANKPVEVQHYTLPAATKVTQETDAEPLFVEITVNTADYLAAPGISYQTSEYRMESAYGHRWAGSLAEQLRRQLRDELLQQYPGYRFISGRGHGDDAAGDTFFLTVEIDEFHGRFDGVAVISGRWSLRDTQNNYLTGQNFFERIPQSEDGYEALVKSLAQGWRKTIGEINREIQALKAESN